MKSSLYVQIIHTSWTKKSRGAPLATPRNAVPLALNLKDSRVGFLTLERTSYNEDDLFKAPQIKREQLELTDDLQYRLDNILLSWNGQVATTRFRQKWWLGGAPEPKIFNEGMGHFILNPGEWAQLRWRGRFSDRDNGSWWYEHTCINLACFIDTLAPDIFLQSEPTRQFIHLPHLR